MLHVEPLRAGKEKIWTHISCSSNTAADTQKIVVPMWGKSVKWPRIRTRHSGPVYFGTGSPRITWLVLKGFAFRGCSAVEAEHRRNLLRLWSQQAESSSSSSASQKKGGPPTEARLAAVSPARSFFFWTAHRRKVDNKNTVCVDYIRLLFKLLFISHIR